MIHVISLLSQLFIFFIFQKKYFFYYIHTYISFAHCPLFDVSVKCSFYNSQQTKNAWGIFLFIYYVTIMTLDAGKNAVLFNGYFFSANATNFGFTEIPIN